MGFLNDKDTAYAPALCCLWIGVMFVFTGLNALRFRAAKEVQKLHENHHFIYSLLRRMIYPKIKGQHGGVPQRFDTNVRSQLDIFTGFYILFVFLNMKIWGQTKKKYE